MTVPPVKYDDFVIYQGADFNETFAFLAGPDGGPLVLLDPTGWFIEFAVKVNIDSTSYYLYATTDNGGVTIDSVNKKCSVFIPGIDTALLSSANKNLPYNLTTTDTNGNIVRRAQGLLQNSPRV